MVILMSNKNSHIRRRGRFYLKQIARKMKVLQFKNYLFGNLQAEETTPTWAYQSLPRPYRDAYVPFSARVTDRQTAYNIFDRKQLPYYLTIRVLYTLFDFPR